MSTTAIAERTNITAIESVLIAGDLAKLQPEQRVAYYNAVCESVGLNPLTKPFDYITLNGKLTLYAKRDATDQLRKIHGVSVRITARETIEGVYIVTAAATDKAGRTDESTGAVNIAGLRGDALANAFMKAETKAKRRVTLSICGLGLLDETEVETIKDSHHSAVDTHRATSAPIVERPKALPSKPAEPVDGEIVDDKGDAYEGPVPITPEMVKRIEGMLGQLKLDWSMATTKQRAGRVVGRTVENLSELTDTEGAKLMKALFKLLTNTAADSLMKQTEPATA